MKRFKTFLKEGGRGSGKPLDAYARHERAKAHQQKVQVRADRQWKHDKMMASAYADDQKAERQHRADLYQQDTRNFPSQDRKFKNMYRHYTVHTKAPNGKKSMFGRPKHDEYEFHAIHHRDASTREIHKNFREAMAQQYPDHKITKIKAGPKVDMSEPHAFKGYAAAAHPDDHETQKHIDHMEHVHKREQIANSHREWAQKQAVDSIYRQIGRDGYIKSWED